MIGAEGDTLAEPGTFIADSKCSHGTGARITGCSMLPPMSLIGGYSTSSGAWRREERTNPSLCLYSITSSARARKGGASLDHPAPGATAS
jgi:hypothetical protein